MNKRLDAMKKRVRTAIIYLAIANGAELFLFLASRPHTTFGDVMFAIVPVATVIIVLKLGKTWRLAVETGLKPQKKKAAH